MSDVAESSQSARNEPIFPWQAEEELTEQQLRQLYNDEEIDRFLELFSAVCTLFQAFQWSVWTDMCI